MKDTLVQSYYRVEHKPLRAGFEPIYGNGWYRSVNVPAPLSLAGCDQFSSGSGPIYGVRLLTEIPFWGDYSNWTFESGIYGRSHNASFDWLESVKSFSSVTNTLTPFTIRHNLTASLDEAGIEAQFDYRIVGGLTSHAGGAIGLAFRQHYEKSLHMVEPGNTLAGGSRDTTTDVGSLPGRKLSLLPSVSFGFSYELPLSQKLHVRPSIDITYPIGGITLYWNGIQAAGGLSFLFDLTPRTEWVPVFVKERIAASETSVSDSIHHTRDTVHAPLLPPLRASIEAVAVNRLGEQSKVVRMTIEEVRTRNAYPILNYIFFDEGSSAFPPRYVRYRSEEEALRDFQGSAERHDIKLMDLYRETLNILGDRLRKYPKSKVTLIGNTSNTGIEHNDLALAKARAEAVRDYLVSIWRIEPERIRTEGRQLPERQSPLATPEGQAENRRVEFRVEDERVTDPVTVMNVEHLATPDRIRLLPSIETQAKAGILSTYAAISADGIVLQSFKGNASNMSAQKVWSPSEETLSRLRDSLSIEYDVWDSAGNHAHAHNSLPLDITRVTSDREERIERFSLILFGFDEARLEKRNEHAIEQAAAMISKIPVQGILIQGLTDETGDPTHNDALSQERAAQVRQRLSELLRSQNVAEPAGMQTEGHGSRDLLYDNRLPEGRFFSRTVNITIQRAPKGG